LAELEGFPQAAAPPRKSSPASGGPGTHPGVFEAGTPAIEAVVGLGAAVTYLQGIGLESVEAHCRQLRERARERLREMPGVRVLGLVPPAMLRRAAQLHGRRRAVPPDRPRSERQRRICVRSGYHCAQPLHEQLRSPPSVRLSFYLYNQPWEIDWFFEALGRLLRRHSQELRAATTTSGPLQSSVAVVGVWSAGMHPRFEFGFLVAG